MKRFKFGSTQIQQKTIFISFLYIRSNSNIRINFLGNERKEWSLINFEGVKLLDLASVPDL